ncbi:hypothetical protein TNCV_1693731 [Trichonephila clavipes]|nr:hypothetical protein TNCV_1693731 [Trichonephila clavipes]
MINQLGVTSARGHGAIVYCLNSGSEVRQTGRHNSKSRAGAPLTIGEAYLKIIMSSFLGFCEWNTRNRWRDGQVCPDVDKELWSLGPDGSGVFLALDKRRGDEKKKRSDPKGEVGEKSSEKRRADRLRKRRGESQSFLLGDADQESETRMSKNALRTGRRQAVETCQKNLKNLNPLKDFRIYLPKRNDTFDVYCRPHNLLQVPIAELAERWTELSQVSDESRSFFTVHTGYFSNIPKCIKAEFIASWACSQSSVVSSSQR